MTRIDVGQWVVVWVCFEDSRAINSIMQCGQNRIVELFWFREMLVSSWSVQTICFSCLHSILLQRSTSNSRSTKEIRYCSCSCRVEWGNYACFRDYDRSPRSLGFDGSRDLTATTRRFVWMIQSRRWPKRACFSHAQMLFASSVRRTSIEKGWWRQRITQVFQCFDDSNSAVLVGFEKKVDWFLLLVR